MASKKVQAIIEEREQQHGNFEANAIASQDIKEAMRRQDGWPELRVVQQEALELIAVKISRILSGSTIDDDWDDIGGYAELGRLGNCEGGQK